MSIELKREVYRLLKLNNNQYKSELFKNYAKTIKETKIRNRTKVYNNIENTYSSKISSSLSTQSLEELKDKICDFYCSNRVITENVSDSLVDIIIEYLSHLAEIEPVIMSAHFISIIIKRILKQLCKCNKKIQLLETKRKKILTGKQNIERYKGINHVNVLPLNKRK